MNTVSRSYGTQRVDNQPVSIDPRISFGAPIVKGVPTWAIKGRYEAGEGIGDICEDFDLKREEVCHGLDFEGIQITP